MSIYGGYVPLAPFFCVCKFTTPDAMYALFRNTAGQQKYKHLASTTKQKEEHVTLKNHKYELVVSNAKKLV